MTEVRERYLTPEEVAEFTGDGPRGAELYPEGPPELSAAGRSLTAGSCRCGGREFYPLGAIGDEPLGPGAKEVQMWLECTSCEAIVQRSMIVEG